MERHASETAPRRRFLLRLSLLLPVPLFMTGTNLAIDEGNLFRLAHSRVARVVLSGREADVPELDVRLLREEIALGSSRPIDVLVLGSSRAMTIGSEFFPGKEVQNWCVAGASIEDSMALYELCRMQNRLPRLLILGVDPWIFNENSEQLRWRSIAKYYYPIAIRLKLEERDPEGETRRRAKRWSQLLSPSYFKVSVRHLPDRCRQVFGEAPPPSVWKILLDGSLRYLPPVVNRDIPAVQNKAREYVSGPVYALQHYSRLDPMATKKLKTFLRAVHDDGVAVKLLLTPYHPYVYRFLSNSNDYRIILSAEQRVRELAEERSLQVIGSYDPSIPEFGIGDYYDGMHMKRESLLALLRKEMK